MTEQTLEQEFSDYSATIWFDAWIESLTPNPDFLLSLLRQGLEHGTAHLSSDLPHNLIGGAERVIGAEVYSRLKPVLGKALKQSASKHRENLASYCRKLADFVDVESIEKKVANESFSARHGLILEKAFESAAKNDSEEIHNILALLVASFLNSENSKSVRILMAEKCAAVLGDLNKNHLQLLGIYFSARAISQEYGSFRSFNRLEVEDNQNKLELDLGALVLPLSVDLPLLSTDDYDYLVTISCLRNSEREIDYKLSRLDTDINNRTMDSMGVLGGGSSTSKSKKVFDIEIPDKSFGLEFWNSPESDLLRNDLFLNHETNAIGDLIGFFAAKSMVKYDREYSRFE